MKLHWQIFLALLLALLAGFLNSYIIQFTGYDPYPVYDFIGALFLNALKMIIVPLITASIISGMANLNHGHAFARLGSKTLFYYLFTSTLAIALGLILVNSIQPGLIDGIPAKHTLNLHDDTAAVAAQVSGKTGGDVIDVFLRMIPPNIVKAAAEGQMLGMIFFSILFGYFIAKAAADEKVSIVKDFFDGMLKIMLRITDLVMRFAPIGVFALVAKVLSTTGVEAFSPLAKFFFTVLIALLAHAAVVLPAILIVIGRVNPLHHVKAMLPALLTAFSTSSSSATLPITMDCVERRAGVSNRISGFVLPLGATINMDGTALYECVAVLFIAQAYGFDLGIGTQLLVVLLALTTSIGVAGIPSASLVAITIIMAAIGLPAEGIGLILAVDRVLDMFRTSVNVFSDSCGAVVIARSEGERTLLLSRVP